MALDVGLAKKNRNVCFEAILTQSSIYQLTMSSVCIGTVRKAMATQTTRQLCKRYLTVMLALLSSVCWLFVSAYAVPYGTYVVTDTLHIPLGTRLYGEAQPVILGSHPKFNDASLGKYRFCHGRSYGGHACPGIILIRFNLGSIL